MTRKIIASVVHSATLTTDERASLLADPVIPQGYCRMQVNYPSDWSESWVGYGSGQRALFRQDTDNGVTYIIVPKSEVTYLSRAGLSLLS